MLRTVAIGLAFVLIGIAAAGAQQPGIKRTILQKTDVPGGAYESVLGMAELTAATAIGRHSHPGTEQGTVIAGEVTLTIEGQPDKTYKAGEAWLVPAGTVHDAKAGAGGAKVMVVYIVEKGKPLAAPAAK